MIFFKKNSRFNPVQLNVLIFCTSDEKKKKRKKKQTQKIKIAA
jgi:hypothetical protein